MTALQLASAHGAAAPVRKLLAAGASPDTRGRDGSTALLLASAYGHHEVRVQSVSQPKAGLLI